MDALYGADGHTTPRGLRSRSYGHSPCDIIRLGGVVSGWLTVARWVEWGRAYRRRISGLRGRSLLLLGGGLGCAGRGLVVVVKCGLEGDILEPWRRCCSVVR